MGAQTLPFMYTISNLQSPFHSSKQGFGTFFVNKLLPNLEGKRNQVELVMQSMVLSKVQIHSNDTLLLVKQVWSKMLVEIVF
jgi:hypothetical protein